MSVSVVVERKINAANIMDHILNTTDSALGTVFSVRYVPHGNVKYIVSPGILLSRMYMLVRNVSMKVNPYNQFPRFFSGTFAVNIRTTVKMSMRRFIVKSRIASAAKLMAATNRSFERAVVFRKGESSGR